MKILGVEAFLRDTSACVLVDGKIKYAVQEERLTRNKRTKSFPIQSVKYCLEGNNWCQYLKPFWNRYIFE